MPIYKYCLCGNIIYLIDKKCKDCKAKEIDKIFLKVKKGGKSEN